MSTTIRMAAARRVEDRYTRVAQGFHWLVLGLLAVQFAVAWTMPDITPKTPDAGLVAWHLSIGATILLVMLLRLAWRTTHTPPPPPADLPRPLQWLSRITHWLLYAILIVLPFMGWANASSRGYPVRLFGIIPLPALVAKGDPFAHSLGGYHADLALVLLGVIALHVSGALFHLVVKRDGVAQRMLPG